ncbi:MED14-domain-containing protein, partial [Polychaeton citri CBS 116435]
MDQRTLVGSQDLKKDQNHVQQQPQKSEAGSQTAPAVRPNSPNGISRHVNGINGIVVNGAPSAATVHADTVNHDAAAVKLTTPPQLDQSWRTDPHSNIKLGTLLEREAQDCYTTLHGLISDLSGKRVPQDTSQANSTASHATIDTNQDSVDKRKRILDFAGHHRDRWIRTLVLSDWARQEYDMAKLIDISLFQKKIQGAHDMAAWTIAQTKRDIQSAKMPNPNIEGALELMSTGKASWVPSLGYVAPRRMPASKLLKILQNMNVALATRLNLHEDLPFHMQDFSIANGRATFRVKDEFEVDLSIADEDPASPFYFIDFRLCFHPAANIVNEQLRSFVEVKLNETLASKGLQGCYDFLHNFVLTHKLNVLKGQFADLVRGRWFDCIKLESMRRSFVVQYWVTQPGSKSWLEFGISTGRVHGGKARRMPTPSISVRWLRDGLEVKDEALHLDWKDLSLERMLQTVISKHASRLLESIQTKIKEFGGSSSAVRSSTESSGDECGLSLGLPSISQPIMIHIESTTGQYCISPPNPITFATEQQLNANAQVEPARRLASLLGTLLQYSVIREADVLGWERIRDLSRQPNLPALFGKDVLQLTLWRCSNIWSHSWTLAATFSLSGGKWWVVHLRPAPDGKGRIIESARPLSTQMSGVKASPGLLLRIERNAVAEVSYAVLAQQLRDLQIQHHFERQASPLSSSEDDSTILPGRNSNLSSIMVRFSQLMQSQSRDKRWRTWASEPIRITHLGSEPTGSETATVLHDVRLSLKEGQMKRLQVTLRRTQDRDIVMSDSGGLALRLRTPFGTPFVSQIQEKLRGLERLDYYATALESLHVKCTAISLSRLNFVYSARPLLSAHLTFASANPSGDIDAAPIRLKLEPPETNPHLKIRVL